jgi:hypothetical protein
MYIARESMYFSLHFFPKMKIDMLVRSSQDFHKLLLFKNTSAPYFLTLYC